MFLPENERPPPALPATERPDWRKYLSDAQLAALRGEVLWLETRSEFRRRTIADGHLRHPWRNVFEADMIFCVIGLRWFEGHPITMKELSLQMAALTSESTVSRHVDDMEAAGTVVRIPDEKDRRRILLIPTDRLIAIGRAFLDARLKTSAAQGFVFASPEAAQDK